VCKNIKANPIIKDIQEKSRKICNNEPFTDKKPLFTDLAFYNSRVIGYF